MGGIRRGAHVVAEPDRRSISKLGTPTYGGIRAGPRAAPRPKARSTLSRTWSSTWPTAAVAQHSV
eukprot:1724715-Pyramimonas_sp.AAC.1